ncbi:MAG TPA: hypothetical protein VGJ58_03645 [Gaiellaceae bacterium]|jgi:hypothetical protein
MPKSRLRFAFLLALPLAAAAIALTAVVAQAGGKHGRPSVRDVMAATAKYHDISVAEGAGYSLLRDAQNIACIDNPPVGGMGVHWVNGGVGDTVIDPLNPEALVYAPSRRNRTLRLAALEYIVFADAWNAQHSSPPSLFGQQFFLTPSPNRFGIPAFYALHVWIWKNNPAGLLQPWNPRVHC